MASLIPANGKSIHHASRSNPDFTSSTNTQHVKTVKLYRYHHYRHSNKANGHYLVRHAASQTTNIAKQPFYNNNKSQPSFGIYTFLLTMLK